ncbi:zinc knuckle CX2CX4HX4C containing protein [Tanacetum coccineum]
MLTQFIRELREDTFLRNKNDDAHEHVERILDIVSLFNIPRVSHDAVMLRVFPITLTGAVKRWADRLPPGTINTWDMLKKAFIQRYFPPSKMAKQLEKIYNFKQEGDETLRKVSNGSSDGIADIANKLDSLGQYMKKLKENVHAIQVGCETCRVAYLDKESSLHEEVKSIKEVKYGAFGRSFPNNSRNSAKYHVDLGASVSIMSFSMYKRLGMRKLKPINMIYEMADKTRSVPRGIMENLLIKIDNFTFLIDFVILDMVEDLRMPIILGRPLLAMAHAKVDVFGKLISLEVGNEKVVFKIKDNFNETPTPIESVCAIRNEVSVTEDDLIKIDHDLFLYTSEYCIKINEFNYLLVIDPDIFAYEVYVQESHEEIDYRWSMLDQGEAWEIEAVEESNRKSDIDLSSVVKQKLHWCPTILQQKEDGNEL